MPSTPPPPPDHWEDEIEPDASTAWPLAIATFLVLIGYLLYSFGCH